MASRSEQKKGRLNPEELERLDRGAGISRFTILVEGISVEDVHTELDRLRWLLAGEYDHGIVARVTVWENTALGGESLSGVHGELSGEGLKPFGDARAWYAELMAEHEHWRRVFNLPADTSDAS